MSDSPLDKLARLFEAFPGIGRRQARRFAFFVTKKDSEYITELSNAIDRARDTVKQCPVSFQYFFEDDSLNHSKGMVGRTSQGEVLAPIERNVNRDTTKLMVVEKDSDIDSIEKTGFYSGKYFVLGNLASLLDTEFDKNTRVQTLKKRAQTWLPGTQVAEVPGNQVTEVILALPATPDGDRTAYLVRDLFGEYVSKNKLVVTELGRGISTGTELEYADTHTLEEALKNRH